MTEAQFYTKEAGAVRCTLCPHNCLIAPGKRGICKVRQNHGGTLLALTYGKVTSVAMDPIEKKPLYHFLPGKEILSIGSWGCNFGCTFCQNFEISQHEVQTRSLSPARVVEEALARGACGVAYTYNEPYIAYEYVLDCAKAVRVAGLKNVMVSNGFYNPEPLQTLLPWIDAWNIDIKSGNDACYQDFCGGHLAPVLQSAKTIAHAAHLEVTTLLIPGTNDSDAELTWLAEWIAENCGPETPAHLSAYFPRYQMQIEQTPLDVLLRARDIFMKTLRHVYLGNVHAPGASDTICPHCHATVIRRSGYSTDTSGMAADGACCSCKGVLNIITD